MSNDEVVTVWKIPKDAEIDIGEFHDVGIYPTGELMAICDDESAATEFVEYLEAHSPSDRHGETMEDAPYMFVFGFQDVRSTYTEPEEVPEP